MYAHVVLGCRVAATTAATASTGEGTLTETDSPAKLKRGILAKMLEMASADSDATGTGTGASAGGSESNRRRIYALWREQGDDDDDDDEEE